MRLQAGLCCIQLFSYIAANYLVSQSVSQSVGRSVSQSVSGE